MTAEEMKLKCMAIAGKIADLYDTADYPEESDMASAANRACLSIVAAIAALPVEPQRTIEPPGCPTPGACSCLREADPRDAQIVEYQRLPTLK